MRVLFDQGVPTPLRSSLPGHEVITAYDLGWSTLSNGELLRAAEMAGFQVLVTTDQNLRYQQNLSDRNIAVLVLATTSWPRIHAAAGSVAAAIETAALGAYTLLPIP